MMSRSCEVDLTAFGKAAHVGKAWEGLDALSACAAFYAKAVAMEQAMTQDPLLAGDYAQLLYCQGLLMADLPLEDPVAYTQLVCKLMK
jgi:hypothetical protein